MGVMINYYREHLHPSARSHYAILEGGKAPNVVPDFAKAWFYVRGGTREMVDEMTKGKAYPSSIPAIENVRSSGANRRNEWSCLPSLQ